MAEKATQKDGVIEGLSNLFNLDGAKKVAAWYIDTTEKLANEVIDFQSTASEWAKETPLAPILEAQQDLGRKFVKRSAETARKIWQIEG